MRKTVTLGAQPLKLLDLKAIISHGVSIALSESALTRAFASHKKLQAHGDQKIIYGFNTGFGPMAHIQISKDDRIQLQYNLIRSHAIGHGQILSPEIVRAILAVRLNTLMRGYSGVPNGLMFLLRDFLNYNILPIIPEHGSVGASGDLVQLAHIALALIGEGEVLYKGTRMPAKHAFEKTRLTPLTIKSREGLAIMNGTAAMTGIAALTVLRAEALLNETITIGAFLYELTGAYDDALAPELHRVRPHIGQVFVAKRVRELLKGSKRLRTRHAENASENTKVQEIYSIRCIPQILGPIYETIQYAKKIVERELNSVTDNPVIVPKKGIFHGGNFHGDYIALEMDKIKIALTKLGLLCERQINFLLNEKVNGRILPPFLNSGTLGLDLGFQGIQFVATSTAAENQALSNPMSIHSIPTNNDNQDIVSMGTNAALLAIKVAENTGLILAITLAATIQAIDILKIEKQLGPAVRKKYIFLKNILSQDKTSLSSSKTIDLIVKIIKQGL